MRSVTGWLGQVIAWVVIGAVVICLVVVVLIPRVAGAEPYTILTGSMRPSLPPGTMVIVKPTEPNDIGVGDVVTYQLESGQAPVVTHRVTVVQYNLSGDVTFITKGDANDVADSDPILPVQIRGKLWYSVPYLGYVNNLLNGAQRQTAVYVVAGGLIVYAGWMFVGAWRGRRRETLVSDESVKE